MAASKAFIDGLLASKNVVVISKSTCPYCSRAKDLLNGLKLKAGSLEWVDIENRSDMNEIQDYMRDLTGARSVPRVFVGGKFVGGCDDTVAAHKSGKLQKLLKEVGALD